MLKDLLQKATRGLMLRRDRLDLRRGIVEYDPSCYIWAFVLLSHMTSRAPYYLLYFVPLIGRNNLFVVSYFSCSEHTLVLVTVIVMVTVTVT